MKTEMSHVGGRCSAQKRFAIYLQCGSGSVHDRWLTRTRHHWDLIVNHYDATHVGQISCDIEFQQTGAVPGTKFTSFFTLLTKWPEVANAYDYILLLDDDIVVAEDGLEHMFDAAATHSLDLAQASLTADSPCAHPICRNPGTTGVRKVNTVEIMMPILSSRALKIGSHLFGQTVSGWGLDMVFGKLVEERLGGAAAILDSVAATHTRQIDPKKGAFYTMLHDANIYSEVELTHLQRLYGTGREISLAGV